MNEAIKRLIEETPSYGEVKLNGEIRLKVPEKSSFVMGKSFSQSLISVTKPEVTIDGANCAVFLEIDTPIITDLNVIYISSAAKNTVIKNLKIFVHSKVPESVRRIVGIYNLAYGVKIINCRIEIISDNQSNLTGIYNNGNLDTHLETRADNLTVNDSYIKTQVLNSGKNNSKTCGIYNNLANSILVNNTFVYSHNIGCGENQEAVGIYTDGRFGRFTGNNIKANGSHNTGKQKEQAFAYGFVNNGVYSIISSNNIVGEWGGMCVGLENRGNYLKADGNKILSTHTIKGRSVRNYADNCVYNGNIITSTSRNPRLFEHNGCNCIISNNFMSGLLDLPDALSGCGIYAAGEDISNNIISGNIIQSVCDCGIFASPDAGIIKDNYMAGLSADNGYLVLSDTKNKSMAERLSESGINSIYD